MYIPAFSGMLHVVFLPPAPLVLSSPTLRLIVAILRHLAAFWNRLSHRRYRLLAEEAVVMLTNDIAGEELEQVESRDAHHRPVYRGIYRDSNRIERPADTRDT